MTLLKLNKEELSPEEKAVLLIESFYEVFPIVGLLSGIKDYEKAKKGAIVCQEKTIEKLSEYDIYSEYEKEILNKIINFKTKKYVKGKSN